MKSHDFGQFIFNSSILNQVQIDKVIKEAHKSKPSLAVAALFLQLIYVDELENEDDDFIRSLITPNQEKRVQELKSGQSFVFAQALIDNGIANFLKLDRMMENYHNLEIPPLETALTAYYEKWRTQPDIDFPFAVEAVRNFHSFLSTALESTIIILPPHEPDDRPKLGATVKIIGEIPIVVGIYADNDVFLRLAARYDSYAEIEDDAFDAVSELLNVFTGHFVVKIAVSRGLEEIPEPPRFGTISKRIEGIKFLSDVGTFYIYIGKSEIFDSM